MKRLTTILIILLTLTLSLSSCFYSDEELEEAKKEAYDQGYEVGYEDGQADAFGAPNGSVIDTRIAWRTRIIEPNPGLIEFFVKVMNVGGDGRFTIHAKLLPEDVVDGRNEDSITLYLTKGEEKELSFKFNVIEDSFYSRAYCTTP